MGKKKRVSLQEPHFSRMEKLLKTKDMRFNSKTYKNLNRNDVMNFFLKDSDRPQLPRRIVNCRKVRKRFRFFGRSKNSRDEEPLTVNWLLENGFDDPYLSWFKDNLEKWEPVPLGKSVEKDSVLRCPITSDTPCVPRCVVNIQSVFFHQKDKWYCTTYSLASVCDYKGLYRQKKVVLDNSERISLHPGNRLKSKK